MGLYHSPKIITDGLWACWDFANKKSFDGSSVTNFKDLVQASARTYVQQTNQVNINQWDPRGYYTVHSPAVNANIDNFDGANTGWQFSNNLNGVTTEATFEAVVETYQNTETQDIGIFGQGGSWRLMQKTQKWRLWFRRESNNKSATVSSGDIIEKNKWYHVVATINSVADTVFIYVNGEQVATDSLGNASPWGGGNNTNVMVLGQAWWGDVDSNFRGAIRLMRMYTKQLSQKQIKQNYDTVKDWMVYAHETKTTW